MAKQNNPSPSKSRPVQTNPVQTNSEKEFDEGANVPSSTKAPVMKSASALNKAPTKRNMSGTKQIFTDLFKLMVAKVIKYEGWDEANEHPDTHPQKFSTWEHTHPFRTYDKKGDKLTTCTPIGGHFHMVEWDDNADPDAPPVIKSISGPMVMSKKKVKGRIVTVAVPANDYDDHTHEVEYLRSAKIEVGAINVEAAAVIAAEAQKTAPVAGVQVN